MPLWLLSNPLASVTDGVLLLAAAGALALALALALAVLPLVEVPLLYVVISVPSVPLKIGLLASVSAMAPSTALSGS
jgi:hypothetical protein